MIGKIELGALVDFGFFSLWTLSYSDAVTSVTV